MKVDFLNLAVNDQKDRDEYLSILNTILSHGRIINGPESIDFENNIAKYISSKYALGVSSGTGALYLALKSLGITKGDEVIIPSLSWLSTAHVVKEIGATPVFADINEELNISHKSIECLITKKTKAIIIVHFMGRCCDIEEINQIAKEYNLTVIEDASQSFGAMYDNKYTGTLAHIGCFSLNPMKVYGAIGEAGLITTNDEGLKDKIGKLRYCGMVDKQYCEDSSLNFRMDTLQAAFLGHRLKKVADIIKKRDEIANYYNSNFDSEILLPEIEKRKKQSHYGYILKVKNRDNFIKKMKSLNIETKVQHYPLMCEQKIYKDLKSETTRAKALVDQIINIPNHENLTDAEVEYIVNSVKESL